ncbi:MAG: TlpA family protein disulfide reductase [Chthoniobacterales bacterium]
MIKKTQLILTLVAILLGFCRETFAADPKPSPIPAPGWQLQDLEGKSINLSDFKGKVVVLNFWATWCPPCREEIPDLVSLQKQYAPQGLVVLGISLDTGGPARVAALAKKLEINYPILMGNAKISAAYGGIRGLPTTFIIDRKGNVVDGLEGETDRATLEAKIKPLL